MIDWAVLQGDCLDVMRTLGDASVDAVVTDPPYGFSFMGREWDHGVPGEAYWREALRVLKPGGHLAAFGGPRTYHRLACAIEDAGFEVRDSLHWVFGAGFPKGGEAVTKRKGTGTALKPAHEPIVLARKPIAGTVAANIGEYGTGALAIDGCRVKYASEGDAAAAAAAAAAQRAGHSQGSVVGKYGLHKPEASATVASFVERQSMGRYPPNLLLSHLPECADECAPGCAVGEMGRQSGVIVSGKRTGKRAGKYGEFRGQAVVEMGHSDTGTAARFFPCFRYQAKASRSEREAGLDGFDCRPSPQMSTIAGNRMVASREEGAHSRTVPTVRNNHPTVKPLALMRWLCRLVTPPGGIVLDPFNGSGSTGCAAVQEGLRYIGIEREPEYVEIARARIAHWAGQEPKRDPAQPDLFSEAS